MNPKSLLSLFLTLLCLEFSPLFAQVNTWTGNGDGINWGDGNNWSLTHIPGLSEDAVIPTGAAVTMNIAVSTQSVTLQGTAILYMSNTLNFTNPSSIATGATIEWSSGYLTGGGTLTNNGTINLSTTAFKQISGGTSLDSYGTIILSGGADMYITDGQLNNYATALIDIQDDGSNFMVTGLGSHSLVNTGTITKSAGSSSSNIYAVLTNNGGTLSSQSGILYINNTASELNGGTYNASAGAELNFSQNVTCTGTLSGTIEGTLTWGTTVYVASSATFNFDGNGIYWTTGYLSGGGTLTNNGAINLTTAASKQIIGGTSLDNYGTINLSNGADMYIADGQLNNYASALIDIQDDASDFLVTGGGSHSLVNTGTITKSVGSGSSYINVELTNNGGSLSSQSGLLYINNTASELNGGTYNASAGAELNFSQKVTCTGTLSGTIEGTLTWGSTVFVASSVTFNFDGNSIYWESGDLDGGGTLTNTDTIFVITNGAKHIYGNTTLVNNGLLKLISGGDIYIADGIINNSSSGVIEQDDHSDLLITGAGSHLLENTGLIKKVSGTSYTNFFVELENNGGIIGCDSGQLVLNNTNLALNGGTYYANSGAELRIGGNAYCSGTLSGTIDGNLNWTGDVYVQSAATLNFGGEGINWSSGNLNGGGVLTNNNVIKLTTTSAKQIFDSTRLVNNDSIRLTQGADLYVSHGVLKNTSTGVIDIQEDACDLTYSTGVTHIVDNTGLIKKSGGTGTSNILAELVNTGGTLEVDSGLLNLNNNQISFSSAIWNTLAGAEITFAQDITCSDTITGTNLGTIDWYSSLYVPDSSIFNFSGNAPEWRTGYLKGGGRLINLTDLDLTTSGTKQVVDSTSILNYGNLNMVAGADVYLTNGIIINMNSGTIDVQDDGTAFTYSTGPNHLIENYGLFEKTGGSGLLAMYEDFINYGSLNLVSGEINFHASLTNTAGAIIYGNGILDLPAAPNFVNNGILSPGASPGSMRLNGNFSMSNSAVLNIDIDGLAGGGMTGGHDSIYVSTNAVLRGTMNVNKGSFTINAGDDFVLMHTNSGLSGSFFTLNLPDISPLKWKLSYGPNDLELQAVDCSIIGVTVTWIGGSTGDWDNAANWDLGVPSWCDDVVIGAGVTITVPVGYGAFASSISLGNGSSIVQDTESSMYVNQ